jgi:DNA invertase Pin-like site-specific DNA recombinase
MAGIAPARAAQYLRMSTEHQQYSLANQAEAIGRYAREHGFTVVKTYADPGKSGLVLKNRAGLIQLLQDVVSGVREYRAILVYDVSRWGRFQDADEAAHYEFLCKQGGIPVHYCAETFANDGTVPSAIMKALKRTMAAEYSRELGAKVYEGQRHIAQRGFSVGGCPRFGLRRMLISGHGRKKLILRRGQCKSLSTDRVILFPGPMGEQRIVKGIFEAALSGERPVSIVRQLNARGVPYFGGRKWNHWSVTAVLRNPKYAGCYCWGRTSQRLSGSTQSMPPDTWTMCHNAFPSIVSWPVFERVQELLNNHCKYTDEEMLDALRTLLAAKGRLSETIIGAAPGVPCGSQYARRFGSLRRAYQLIGYEQVVQLTVPEQRANSIRLRNELIARILDWSGKGVRLAKRDEKRRPHLVVNEHFRVCIITCPSFATENGHSRWYYHPPKSEYGCMKLACALDPSNSRIIRMYILTSQIKRQRIKSERDFLKHGLRLRTPAGFSRSVIAVARRWAN